MTLPPPWPEPVLVVVPTYNEAETLAAVLGRLRAAVPTCDVLVVDDGSPDGTATVAAEWAARDACVHLLRRSAKRGLGAAYKAGFGWGLERGYEVFVEMDADGSHAPEQLPRLLTPLAWADLVIGSRYVTGGGVTNWPAHRRLLSHAGNAYTRLALGLPVADSTAGFRVFRRTALEAIDYRGVESQGYCFQVDMTRRAVHAGLDVVEVPITFVERESGQSKMTTAIVGEALWRVTQWGVTDRLARVDRLLGRGPRRRDRAASLGGATRLGGRRSAEGGAAAPTVRQSYGPDGSGRWARRGS